MNKPSPENASIPPDALPEKQERRNFETRVRQEIALAYQDVAFEYKDRLMDPGSEEIYWQPMCQEFSEKLHARLLPLNAQPKYIYLNKLPKDFQPNFRHHILLAVTGPDGEDYFIDGTWQQFIEKPDKKTGLLFEPAGQVLSSEPAKNAPKEIKELWKIGLCMLESRQIIGKAQAPKKMRIKNAILTTLRISETDYDNFTNLKSNFGIEMADKILGIIRETK